MWLSSSKFYQLNHKLDLLLQISGVSPEQLDALSAKLEKDTRSVKAATAAATKVEQENR